MESKLNTIRRPLICSASSETRWSLSSTESHSLKALPARLPSAPQLGTRARSSAGWNWLGSPTVRGEKPGCASQQSEPVFPHRKEIKEFGQLFPEDCQHHLRTYVAVFCSHNNSGGQKYLRLSNSLVSLA